mgnify:CR=1 FL=1
MVRGGDVRIPRNFRDFLDFGESRGSLYFFRTQRHKYTTILNSLTNCILNTEYFSFSIAPIEKE